MSKRIKPLKIFIETDALIDMAVRSDHYPQSFKLLNDLIETPEFSLWVSAASLININHIVSKDRGREKARALFKFIQEEFSIIPFRNSIFVKAVTQNDTDFDDQVQIASAEAFEMDCIISRNVDRFRSCSVPALTPGDFLEKWNAREFNSNIQVPFLDLKAQHHQIYNEIDDRITDIIANTAFVLGKHVEEFEKRFAELQGAKYCIGVSSGTDALHIALMALEIGPGDVVIVPVNTFIATAEAVNMVGAEPVFVDCDHFYNLDVKKLREIIESKQYAVRSNDSRITNNDSRITAIIPVHLYGQPANMNEIMALAEEYGLYVVEDCAQAHLAKYKNSFVGNFGQFGCFSFYPGKNLGAYGEAGGLVTNDPDLYQKAKMIRQHGEIERYQHQRIGHNFRMEALQGAVLSTKLKYIRQWTEKRQKNAQVYNELLKDIQEVKIPAEIDHVRAVYHLYVIQTEARDALQKYLNENNIATGLHYPVPLHLQRAYAHLGYKKGDFPVAEELADEILSLPMYPELTEAQIRYVAEQIGEFYGK